jgi:hypothetical protein
MASDRERTRPSGQRSCQPRNWQRAQCAPRLNMGCGDGCSDDGVAAGRVLRSACSDEARGLHARACRWLAVAVARSVEACRRLKEAARARARAKARVRCRHGRAEQVIAGGHGGVGGRGGVGWEEKARWRVVERACSSGRDTASERAEAEQRGACGEAAAEV